MKSSFICSFELFVCSHKIIKQYLALASVAAKVSCLMRRIYLYLSPFFSFTMCLCHWSFRNFNFHCYFCEMRTKWIKKKNQWPSNIILSPLNTPSFIDCLPLLTVNLVFFFIVWRENPNKIQQEFKVWNLNVNIVTNIINVGCNFTNQIQGRYKNVFVSVGELTI